MGTRQYNFIFPKLVGAIPANPNEPQNILGLLAYGIYKQEKIAYIEAFKRKNGARDPEEHELDEFHTQSEARVFQYLRDAERQLAGFTDSIIKENLKDFERAAEDGKKKALAGLIQDQRVGFEDVVQKLKPTKGQTCWHWCGSGVVGNVAFLLLIALLMLISSIWVANPVDTIIKKISPSISTIQSAAPPVTNALPPPTKE